MFVTRSFHVRTYHSYFPGFVGPNMENEMEDELDVMKAELKEFLQDLVSGGLSCAENDDKRSQVDVKTFVNESESLGNIAGSVANETKSSHFNITSGNRDSGTKLESEKVQQWRAAFQERVLEKDRQEEKAKEVWKKQAAKDLEDFYKRSESVKKPAVKNVDMEVVEEGGGVLEVGQQENIWKRVAQLCDFDSKVRNVKDVSRMRSVILALSDSPPMGKGAREPLD